MQTLQNLSTKYWIFVVSKKTKNKQKTKKKQERKKKENTYMPEKFRIS